MELSEITRKSALAASIAGAMVLVVGCADTGRSTEQTTRSEEPIGIEQEMQRQAEQEQRTGPSFAELDLNGDGRISWAESNRVEELVSSFEQVDEDADGSISRSEFSAFELETGETEQKSPLRKPGVEPELYGPEVQ